MFTTFTDKVDDVDITDELDAAVEAVNTTDDIVDGVVCPVDFGGTVDEVTGKGTVANCCAFVDDVEVSVIVEYDKVIVAEVDLAGSFGDVMSWL